MRLSPLLLLYPWRSAPVCSPAGDRDGDRTSFEDHAARGLSSSSAGRPRRRAMPSSSTSGSSVRRHEQEDKSPALVQRVAGRTGVRRSEQLELVGAPASPSTGSAASGSSTDTEVAFCSSSTVAPPLPYRAGRLLLFLGDLPAPFQPRRSSSSPAGSHAARAAGDPRRSRSSSSMRARAAPRGRAPRAEGACCGSTSPVPGRRQAAAALAHVEVEQRLAILVAPYPPRAWPRDSLGASWMPLFRPKPPRAIGWRCAASPAASSTRPPPPFARHAAGTR